MWPRKCGYQQQIQNANPDSSGSKTASFSLVPAVLQACGLGGNNSSFQQCACALSIHEFLCLIMCVSYSQVAGLDTPQAAHSMMFLRYCGRGVQLAFPGGGLSTLLLSLPSAQLSRKTSSLLFFILATNVNLEKAEFRSSVMFLCPEPQQL